jgi:hypothetical protein
VSPDKERLIAALGSPGVFTSYPEILDHCCAAWNKLTEQPWRIMSIGLRDWPTGSDQWDLVSEVRMPAPGFVIGNGGEVHVGALRRPLWVSERRPLAARIARQRAEADTEKGKFLD